MIPLVFYLKCYAALIIGLMIHTISKYNEAQDLYLKGNVGTLTFGTFIKQKISSHILNVACTLLWLLFMPDFVRQYPEINGSVYLANIMHIGLNAIAGWANSSIILKVLGTGTKYAMDVIDKKTNTADGVIK